MTASVTLLYLGSEPEPVTELVSERSGGPPVTVTVVPSVDEMRSVLRRSPVDGTIVDDAVADGSADRSLSSFRSLVPDVPIVVWRTDGGGTTDASDVDDATVATGTPAQRWATIESAVGDDFDESTPSSSAVELLNWSDPTAASSDPGASPFMYTPALVDTFLNGLLDIFFVFDLEMNFRVWNNRFSEVTGYTDEEIASMEPLDFIVEEDHGKAYRRIETIVEEGEATAEFRIRCRDGETIPYSFTGSVVEAESGEKYISGIGHDITDRKEREEELRRERDLTKQILETSPVGIAVRDTDGELRRRNSRAEEIFGLSEVALDEDGRENGWQLYDEDGESIPTEDHPLTRVPETGEAIYGYTHAIELPDGTTKWLSANGAPLTDADGDVTSLVFAVDDITELKEHEQELARRKRELDEAVTELKRSNAELERFAYAASHDLKEPLRMVSNYLGLLEQRYGDELDEDAVDFIEYAVDGAERMQDLINGLLKYSRVQRHDPPLESTDVESIMETVRSNLDVAIDEADAEVTAESLPTVVADSNQVIQVFQNLVSNAIKYAGDDRPRIHVGAEYSDGMYRFAVEDDGIGMDEETREHIFDVFYSGAASESTGVGLAICKKIVENHGGRIWVDSAPGEGSTFYFTLPAEEDMHPRNRSASPLPTS